MSEFNEQKERRFLALIIVGIIIISFFGGIVSGYFYFRAEQRAINSSRDAAISDIQTTLHALDIRTSDCLK